MGRLCEHCGVEETQMSSCRQCGKVCIALLPARGPMSNLILLYAGPTLLSEDILKKELSLQSSFTNLKMGVKHVDFGEIPLKIAPVVAKLLIVAIVARINRQ